MEVSHYYCDNEKYDDFEKYVLSVMNMKNKYMRIKPYDQWYGVFFEKLCGYYKNIEIIGNC